MAKVGQFKMSRRDRQLRTFSDEFKRAKVYDLERKLVTIAEICREYEVTRTAVYGWLAKYSINHRKGVRMIMEHESDTRKIAELKAQIRELEQIIGQKQLQIDFQAKMIEMAQEKYGVDFKKKSPTKPSSGTGHTETSIG
ncbi:MAG: transposase [Bacteroidales bacterium]|nr:transposase [Bacteroidales bacterium]